MYPGFLGPIPAELCDPSGHLTPAGHMACVSDGVPYYMIKTRPPSPRGIGGAALEYRYVYRRPARQGDLLAVRTGVRAVHNKAFELCHFIFDAVTGQCVATSEAVVVSFDLKARKAAELRPDDRASLESMIVDGLQA
jgi:acyl-CoA thioester hydrolase